MRAPGGFMSGVANASSDHEFRDQEAEDGRDGDGGDGTVFDEILHGRDFFLEPVGRSAGYGLDVACRCHDGLLLVRGMAFGSRTLNPRASQPFRPMVQCTRPSSMPARCMSASFLSARRIIVDRITHAPFQR